MQFITKLLPASKPKLVVSFAGVMALVLFTGMVLVEAAKVQVTFSKDGEEQMIKTSANTVGEMLEEAEVTVGEHDALSHPPETLLEAGMVIGYKQAKQVNVMIDGKEDTYYTTADTVGEFLEVESFGLSEHDDVSHASAESVKSDMHIIIDKGYEILIHDGGEEKKVWTAGKNTVGKLLKEHDIQIGKEDKLKPGKKKAVNKDTAITIVRVEKQTDETEEKVDFETEEKQDDSLAKGKEKVISEGQEGIVLKKYEVTFENGKEVSRELISENVQQKEEKRVVAIGTKEAKKKPEVNEPKTAAAKEKKPQTKKKAKPQPAANTQKEKSAPSGNEMTMTATAYSASCNGCSGVTATGIDLNANPNMKVVAVDPGVIPLGSKVWVEGYGEAIAGDTGGAINGNRIDLHVPSGGEANDFGYQQVKVKVIN